MGLPSNTWCAIEAAAGRLAIVLLGSACVASSLAAVVDVPAAARPGAIRPGEERQTIPQQPSGEVFEVPAVVDRPLEIDTGTRIQVSSFELLGAVDRPKHDISTDDIQHLLDGKLGGQATGFTVGRLQEVADEVTRYYRERGLILAQAFVPVQNVTDGVVKIQILEGVLGRVVTEGNEMYDEKVLQQPFRKLIDQPVTNKSAEAALLGLTEYPGISLFGVFQPGQQVGTADMVVKVQEEKRFEAGIRADNHGIRETGQNRYRLIGSVNNLTGAGDKFTATLQHTEQPSF